jgi:hypothetical protein
MINTNMISFINIFPIYYLLDHTKFLLTITQCDEILKLIQKRRLYFEDMLTIQIYDII